MIAAFNGFHHLLYFLYSIASFNGSVRHISFQASHGSAKEDVCKPTCPASSPWQKIRPVQKMTYL